MHRGYYFDESTPIDQILRDFGGDMKVLRRWSYGWMVVRV